jgi:hypothetical protein
MTALRPVRIANASGFYGDRISAPAELLEGPDPIDVITGDYLAELTMLIMWKAREKDPTAGYATTFLRQMEAVLGTCLDRGIRVVTNAGGLNPHGLAERLHQVADRLGLRPGIAVVEGDDLVARLEELGAAGNALAHLDSGRPLAEAGGAPVTANAYLGAWGIVAALDAGADVVVCPRVTDASLVVGPAAWWHGWRRDDWDRLAGAVVAGHVIECGPQATGGNYPFLDELPDSRYPGFPIAEIAADGSAVITKQPGTGGAVTIGTVTAQLLYEIAEPAYANPDVVSRFDTIELSATGPDRVTIAGTRGEPPGDQLKVAVNFAGGYRNTMTMVLTGLDIERKAAHAEAMLWEVVGGRDQFAAVDVDLVRRDRADASTNAEATAELRVTVKDDDPGRVGRRFANAVVELSLASYSGFFTTTPPTSETAFGVYWPTLVPASEVEHAVVLPDGRRVVVQHTSAERPAAPVPSPPPAAPWHPGQAGPTVRQPLGLVCGARSGDKGGNANIGLWATSDLAHRWLVWYLTVDRFRALVPEADGLEVRRFQLPNLRALNFVVVGILGDGVASSTRPDPQAKGLGEFVRSRLVDLPVALLDAANGSRAQPVRARGAAEP